MGNLIWWIYLLVATLWFLQQCAQHWCCYTRCLDRQSPISFFFLQKWIKAISFFPYFFSSCIKNSLWEYKWCGSFVKVLNQTQNLMNFEHLFFSCWTLNCLDFWNQFSNPTPKSPTFIDLIKQKWAKSRPKYRKTEVWTFPNLIEKSNFEPNNRVCSNSILYSVRHQVVNVRRM